MKFYQAPEAELIIALAEDILTGSTGYNEVEDPDIY